MSNIRTVDDTSIESQKRPAESAFPTGSGGLERSPLVTAMFESLGNHMTFALRAVSPTPLFLSVAAIGSSRLADVAEGFETALFAVLTTPSWEEPVIVLVGYDLVGLLVEALVGGDGSEAPETLTRSLTNVERRLCCVVLEEMARCLSRSLAGQSEIAFKLDKVDPKGQFILLGRRGLGVLTARMNVAAFGLRAQLLICVPQFALRPLVSAPLDQAESATVDQDALWAQRMERGLKSTVVDLRAYIDEPGLLLGDVANFAVGKTVPLGMPPTGRLVVEANGVPLYWSRLGRLDGHLSVRLDESVDERKDFIDGIRG